MSGSKVIVTSKNSGRSKQSRRPAITPEGRDNQMASLAYDLAEQQLRDGTASSQVITHFLKISSSKNKLEEDILELQKELVKAKTENLKSAKHADELYVKALKAMRIYSGNSKDDDYEE